MSAADPFFDTNVLLYLLSPNAARADKVEELLTGGGTISVQVLNEFASVALRKLKLSVADGREILGTIRAVCPVESVTTDTHDRALAIVERYAFSLYDSLLIASSLIAGCDKFYTEDLQHGQIIERQLRILNPFIAH